MSSLVVIPLVLNTHFPLKQFLFKIPSFSFFDSSSYSSFWFADCISFKAPCREFELAKDDIWVYGLKIDDDKLWTELFIESN